METGRLTRSTEASSFGCDNDKSAPLAEFWRDPSMRFAESRRACRSRACYKPHTHQTFSVGAVDAGRSVFTGASGVPWTLQPGMMVFIPAGAVHACNPLPNQDWSYQMLHIDAAWLKVLLTEMHIGPDGLLSENTIRVTADNMLYRRFTGLNETLFSDVSAEDKYAAFIEFFGDCEHGTCAEETLPVMSPEVSRTLQHVVDLMQHTDRHPLTLAELASQSGMSRYQLIRAFRASTGMTPHAYQLNIRINQARLLLQTGRNITDIAYRLGFADQSHFQRVFKAHTGVTPGCYRC